MIDKIYNWVMKHGEVSQKKSILTVLSNKSDNVYTKKVMLPNKKLRISGCLVKSVSLTSNNGKFDDVTPSDLRVNFTNMFDKWVNVPAKSLSENSLKQIYMAMSWE